MARLEMSDRVLLLEDLEDGINVQVVKGTIRRQSVCVVSDIKFLVEEPHISFHPDTAGIYGFIERHFAPVVVVGMASNGSDVAGEVSGPMRESFRWLPGVSPVFEYPIEVVWKECHESAQCEGQELNNATDFRV